MMEMVCALLTSLAALRASGTTSISTSPASSSSTAVSSSSPAHRGHPRSIVGEIADVSIPSGIVSVRETLHDGSPKTLNFKVSDQTRIVRGKETLTLPQLKPNDHVTIKYGDESGGETRALIIRVTPTAPARPDSPK